MLCIVVKIKPFIIYLTLMVRFLMITKNNDIAFRLIFNNKIIKTRESGRRIHFTYKKRNNALLLYFRVKHFAQRPSTDEESA